MEGLLSKASEHPSVTIVYFVPDSHKSGGSYQTYTGSLKRFDDYEKVLVFADGKTIEVSMITKISRFISVMTILSG